MMRVWLQVDIGYAPDLPVWEQALGIPLQALDGQRALEAIPMLAGGINRLELAAGHYRQHTSPGFRVEAAQALLVETKRACQRQQDARLRVTA